MNSQFSESDTPDNNVLFNENKPIDLFDALKHNLAEWAIHFNINRNAFDGLLVILRKVPMMSVLPKDSRTVLETRKTNETQCLTTISPGLYYHFGLDSAIKGHFKFFSTSDIDVIKIVIGNDGLPISKSSASQIWPILGYIRPFKTSVFPI